MTRCHITLMLASFTLSMNQPKFDFTVFFIFTVFKTFSDTYVFNDTSIGQAIFANLGVLYPAISFLLFFKTIDVIITLLVERDFFKSGHL